MDLSSVMETVFSVGIVVAMVALVAWRRYKEGQRKPASGKRAVPVGTSEKPVVQRAVERGHSRPVLQESSDVPHVSGPVQPADSGIRMKTPADARKAFLYSEIFRRKY